jgi:hypothetical protein
MGKFDSLIENAKHERPTFCLTCLDKARPAVRELFETVHEKNAHTLSVPTLYKILCKTEKGFKERVTYSSFRHHVSAHEPLWLRGKPRAS